MSNEWRVALLTTRQELTEKIEQAKQLVSVFRDRLNDHDERIWQLEARIAALEEREVSTTKESVPEIKVEIQERRGPGRPRKLLG